MKALTYEDFKIIDSPESATPEQIELVNRAVAEVEGLDPFVNPDAVMVSTDKLRYVQDDNNSNRVIRKAIDDMPILYHDILSRIMNAEASNQNCKGIIAAAPQSARLYSAYKTLGGE